MRLPRTADQRGASSVEYALLTALIAVVIIASMTFFGGRTAALFKNACSSIPGTSQGC
jgi:Flp pilus assembly pilin Flp